MKSQQDLNEQEQRQLMFQAQVSGIRRAQQRASQPQPPLSPGYGVMAPAAKYFDIPLVEDDDFYFLGHPGNEAPFSATPKPAYFDNFESACQEDEVARLQHVLSQNKLTPVLLHHGLTLTLATGSVDTARELLHQGAPIAKRTPELILTAPQNKQIPLLDLLVTQGWTPSHHLFMQAIPNIQLMRWFLSHGVNPNYGIKRDTPTRKGGPSNECADALETAATKGSAEAIEILIEAGANIAYGVPLHTAAGATPPGHVFYGQASFQPRDFDKDRIPAMEVLLKYGADINEREETPHMTPSYPIVYAVTVGAVSRAQWLLDHGADPQLKGPYGSAVEYAMRMGSDEMKALFHKYCQS